MAVRLLEHFELSMEKYCSMLSEEGLNRQELATIKWNVKNNRVTS